MGHNFTRIVLGLLMAAASSACAVSEAHRQREREMLTRRIVDDAIAYNEAYSGAISGQILLNIMRAYNRQPRQYMSMSGFTNTPPDSRQNTLSLSDLPLGDLGEEWGAGGFSMESTTHREPEYKVEPFSTQAFAQISFHPTPGSVLRRYWDQSWSPEVLMLLMADSMESESLVSGERRPWFNSAASIVNDCADSTFYGAGCEYVREVRRINELIYSHGRAPLDGAPANARAVCGLIAAYAPSRPVRAVAPPPAAPKGPSAAPANPPAGGAPAPGPAAPTTAPAEPCLPSIVIEDRIYRFSLRSLDGMVFYVGELLRGGADPALLEARLSVTAPGNASRRVPMFRVARTRTFAEERGYAASAAYAGARYSAGPGANHFCPLRSTECGSDASADRSGTILELLVGILAYNQSESAVSAPEPRNNDD